MCARRQKLWVGLPLPCAVHVQVSSSWPDCLLLPWVACAGLLPGRPLQFCAPATTRRHGKRAWRRQTAGSGRPWQAGQAAPAHRLGPSLAPSGCALALPACSPVSIRLPAPASLCRPRSAAPVALLSRAASSSVHPCGGLVPPFQRAVMRRPVTAGAVMARAGAAESGGTKQQPHTAACTDQRCSLRS